MYFAGIDFSMSCPAITVGLSTDFKKCKSFFYSADKKLQVKYPHDIYGFIVSPYESQEERFDNLSEWAITILNQFKVTHVCLEGYAFGAKGTVFDIGENTGVLKHKMWKGGIKFITVPPMTVKKYFTGKGNSNKIVMHESFIERTGIDLTTIIKKKADGNPISDIVDSYAMLCYGIDEGNLI